MKNAVGNVKQARQIRDPSAAVSPGVQINVGWRRSIHWLFNPFVLLALGFVVLFHPPLLHPGEMLLGSDIEQSSYATGRAVWHNFLIWRSFPYWDSTILGGRSLVGDALPAMINPLRAASCLPLAPALTGFILWAEMVLAAWGMFLFARIRGCNAWGAGIAALAFVGSGKTAAHLFAGQVELLATMLGLPWILWATERVLQHKRTTDIVGLGVILTLVATFGSLQAVCGHILFLLAYAGFALYPTFQRKQTRAALTDVGRLFLGVAAFAGLGAAWIFPHVRQAVLLGVYSGHTNAAPTTITSLAPVDVLRFIWPFAGVPEPRPSVSASELGYFWETTGYPGLVTLCLAMAVPLALSRKREVQVTGVLAILTLLLAFGPHTPLYRLLSGFFPGETAPYVPGRSLFYFNLCAALLAGWALTDAPTAKFRWAWVAVPAGLWQAVIVGTLAFRGPGLRPEIGLWLPAIVLFLLSLLTFLWAYGDGSLGVWRIGCVALLMGELFWVWRPLMHTVKPKEVLSPSLTGAFLAERMEDAPFRYYDPTGLLSPRTAARFGLETINGPRSGANSHQLDLYKKIWREDGSTHADLRSHEAHEIVCPTILDVLNVEYFISAQPIMSSEYEEVFRIPLAEAAPFRSVFRRTTVLPRAWVAARAEVPPPGVTVLDALCSIDPREVCLVDTDSVEGSAAYQPLKVHRRAPGDLTLRFCTEEAGMVVLSESWHPDWRATDRGMPVTVRRVNHGLVGVPVEPGEHSLRVYYYPWDFFVGLGVSGATAAVALVVALTAAARRRRTSQGDA